MRWTNLRDNGKWKKPDVKKTTRRVIPLTHYFCRDWKGINGCLKSKDWLQTGTRELCEMMLSVLKLDYGDGCTSD